MEKKNKILDFGLWTHKTTTQKHLKRRWDPASSRLKKNPESETASCSITHKVSSNCQTISLYQFSGVFTHCSIRSYSPKKVRTKMPVIPASWVSSLQPISSLLQSSM